MGQTAALTAAFEAVERRCTDHVEADRWHQAVEDGRRCLPSGVSGQKRSGAEDLFCLHAPMCAAGRRQLKTSSRRL